MKDKKAEIKALKKYSKIVNESLSHTFKDYSKDS